MPEGSESQESKFSANELEKLARAFDAKSWEISENFVTLEMPDALSPRQRASGIYLDSASAIIAAIDRGAERMKDYEGWIDPGRGYAEFEVRQQGINLLGRSPDRFTFEMHPCTHEHRGDPPGEVVDDHFYPTIRVTSSRGECIEISRNSELCTPLRPAEPVHYERRAQDTLKVFLATPTGKCETLEKAQELADSFIFELNARNGAPFSLRPRLERPRGRTTRAPVSDGVRFPRTSTPKSVSALFSIPSDFSFRGNSTLAYLAYYQVLEYYLPAVHKRGAVKKIRRILRSLDFDEGKDASVLRVLNSVERDNNASEREQLRTLVEECIPREKLVEFFELDHGDHFGKRGPISSVPVINLRSGEPLSVQVANRVYMIRNRIVHAKDDPRYAEAKILLPVSAEAMRLGSDLRLIRMLAIEAISDNQ